MDDNLITPSDFFHRGLERLEAGKFSEAVNYFEQAVEREYFSPDIYVPMAEALFEVGRIGDCQKWLKKAQDAGAISPDEALMWRGSCFLEQRKIRRAISAFNRVLESRPDHPEAHFKRGLALTEIGSPDRALEAFQEAERLLRATPDAETEALAEVLMWKGRALTRLGRRPEGLQLMFEAFEIAPDHPGPYNEIADSFRFSGDLGGAEEWYRKGLERLPEDPSLHNDYGNLLRETGRYRDSLEHLSTAIDQDANRSVAYYNRALTLERLELFDEALKDYDTVIDSNPTDLDAKLRKLDLMTQMGLFTDATNLLECLTETEQRSDETKEATARMHNRRAIRAELEGDVKTALDCHRAALSLHPDFLDVESPAPGDDRADDRITRLIQLLKQTTDDEHAPMAQLLRAAAQYTHWRLRLLRDAGDDKLEDIREQIGDDLKKALKMGAFPAQTHKLLAEFSFYELKDDKRALKHADAGLKECTDFVGALWIKAVVLSEGQMRPDLAVDCYRRMLQITPNNSSVLLNLGDLYLDHGQPHRALAYYRRVLEDRPGDVSVNRDIAHCYLALKRYGEAIACFSRLETQGVMQLEVKLDLAEAHLAVGERVEAGHNIEEAIVDNAGLDPRIDARATELMAALMLARRNPKGAIRQIKKLTDAISTMGILQLARAEILLENHDEAWRRLEEITVTLDPHVAEAIEARYHQARILFAQGKLDDAVAKVDEMLESAPLDERAYRLKAWIQMLEGDLEKADETEEAKTFALQVSKVHRLLQFEDYAEALSNADALCDDYPTRVEPRYYRACALAQLGEDDAALDVVRELMNENVDLRERLLEEFYLEPLRLNDRIEFRDEPVG